MPSYAFVGLVLGLVVGVAVNIGVQYAGWVSVAMEFPVGILCGMFFSALGVVTAEYLHHKSKG